MMSAAEPPGTAGRHLSDPGPAGTMPSEDVPPARPGQPEDPAAAGAGRPEDLLPAEEALAQVEIQATREELAETVAALAANADVKAQMRDKAREVSGNLRGRATQMTQSARSAAGPRTGQVRDRASAAGTTVKQAIPAPAQRAVSRAAMAARDKRAPVAAAGAAAAVLAAGWLILRSRQRP